LQACDALGLSECCVDDLRVYIKYPSKQYGRSTSLTLFCSG